MFSTFRNTAVSLGAAALALAQFAAPAQAAYVVTLDEVPAGGGITNVVATGSGSLDTTDLSPSGETSPTNSIDASLGYIHLNDTTDTAPAYTGETGPSSFGGGGSLLASSATNGNAVSIQGNAFGATLMNLPFGYVSGSPLGTSTITFDNTTLAALGVIDGTYTWTWGTGAHADSFTLQIGPTALVPEPASLTLLAMGLASLGMVLRTRRA